MTDLEQRTGDAFHDAVVASGPGPGRQKWWLEIPLAVAFYILYAQIRDWHGGGAVHQRGERGAPRRVLQVQAHLVDDARVRVPAGRRRGHLLVLLHHAEHQAGR